MMGSRGGGWGGQSVAAACRLPHHAVKTLAASSGAEVLEVWTRVMPPFLIKARSSRSQAGAWTSPDK